MVAGQQLPDDATVILHVGKARQLPKDADICEAIDQDAFRCDDDGISVTWVEHFEGDEQFRQAAIALKGALKLKKSGVIASAKVGDIRAILERIDVPIVVETDPQQSNEAHCLIKGIAATNLSALLALTLAFPANRFVRCDQIAGLI